MILKMRWWLLNIRRTSKHGKATAAQWTRQYATEDQHPVSPYEAKVKNLTDMGFDAARALDALTKTKGDENAAVALLLQG